MGQEYRGSKRLIALDSVSGTQVPWLDDFSSDTNIPLINTYTLYQAPS